MRQYSVNRPWRIGVTSNDELHLLDSPTFATYHDALAEVTRRDPAGRAGEIVVRIRAFAPVPTGRVSG